jgi:hypothetical protein
MTAATEVIEEQEVMTEPGKENAYPITYGGIVVYNELEYQMLDVLSIRMLRWLGENGNILAERLVRDIDELDATKVEMTDDYAKNLVKKTGNGLEDNRKSIAESILKRMEEIRTHKLHIIPDYGDPEDTVEDEEPEEVTHSLFEHMGDMYEFEDN